MNDDRLHERLRRLGEAPVPAEVAERHLGMITTAATAASHRPRRAIAAAAAVCLLAVGGVAAAGAGTGGPERIALPAAAPAVPPVALPAVTEPDDESPAPEDSTVEEPPGIAIARERTATPDDETDSEAPTTAPEDADECQGAPWFAGIFPHIDGFAPGARGEQAREFAALRAACDDADDDADEADPSEERNGPPEGRPVGSPEGRPGSPEAGSSGAERRGPPDGRPVGPPTGRPTPSTAADGG